MKRKFLLLAGLCVALCGPTLCSMAQTDTGKGPLSRIDTIRIGNMIIIKKGNPYEEADSHKDDSTEIRIRRRQNYYRAPNISTNWLIFQIGYDNYTDRTNYASSAAQQFAPGATKDWFNLRSDKSINVNIYLVMQRLNLIRHVVNLKYGFGVELNNYRYTDNIKYLTNPAGVIMDTTNYNKNKLAADYWTVPLMLNFNFTPHRKEYYGFSVGMSAGYKYSSRQKLRSDETGKFKIHGDFDMEPWKLSWIGELRIGSWVKLYGSLATKSMFRSGLDQTPYTMGMEFSSL